MEIGNWTNNWTKWNLMIETCWSDFWTFWRYFIVQTIGHVVLLVSIGEGPFVAWHARWTHVPVGDRTVKRSRHYPNFYSVPLIFRATTIHPLLSCRLFVFIYFEWVILLFASFGGLSLISMIFSADRFEFILYIILYFSAVQHF